jgi:hypothetical protein
MRYIMKIRCTEAASRNEREEIVITAKGIGRLQGKGGVHVMPHYKRKKWSGIIQTGNLETKRSAGGRVLQRGPDASNVRRMRANPIYC